MVTRRTLEDEPQHYLPIVASDDKELVNLLIRHNNTQEQPQALQGCYKYMFHFSPEQTPQGTLRGPWVAHITQGWLRVNTYVASCRRRMSQEPGQVIQGADMLGLPYSQVAIYIRPMTLLS